MSDEEKVKAYDEALIKARELLNSPRTCFDINQLRDLFHELRESESERMRRELVDFINHYRHNTDLTSEQAKWCKSAISYLENQKERGPLTKEEEYTLMRIKEYLEDNACPSDWLDLLHSIYILPYQKSNISKILSAIEDLKKELPETLEGLSKEQAEFARGQQYELTAIESEILYILQQEDNDEL